MFVANDKEFGSRVTSLDPAWQMKFEELRALAASGRLVCAGCGQMLRFRVGEQRRPHFAHRVLSECPLAKQSPEVLEAKAQLYEWLIGKYPEKVELDVNLMIPEWTRFADLLVRCNETTLFAYWVFDRSPRDRYALLHNMPNSVSRNIIFTQVAHQRKQDDRLLLTAAQRDLISNSKYDASQRRGHLHFFNTDTNRIILYRGLHCVHEPNVYAWDVVREAALIDSLICPTNGEIVFKADVDDCQQRRNEAKEVRPMATTQRASSSLSAVQLEARPEFDVAWMSRPLKCSVCGRETTNYSVATPGNGSCVCRTCLPQYVAARQ